MIQRKKPHDLLEKKVLHSSDFLPGTLRDRHIRGSVLQIGQAADRPDGSTHTKMYYELDTKKLKIWNKDNEAWEEVQFS